MRRAIASMSIVFLVVASSSYGSIIQLRRKAVRGGGGSMTAVTVAPPSAEPNLWGSMLWGTGEWQE